MRVAEHLGDGKDSPGFESAITLCQGGSTIRDLAEGRTKEHEIETRLRDLGVRGITEDRLQVRDAGLVRSTLETVDHRWLDVDPDRFALG
jgi:hypothetical protein